MIIKEDPRSMSQQQADSRLRLKEKVWAALTAEEAIVLTEALDKLAAMPLNAAPRWRVQQMEHILCQKEPVEGHLDEP